MEKLPSFEDLIALVKNGFASCETPFLGATPGVYFLGSQKYLVVNRKIAWCKYYGDVITEDQAWVETKAFLKQLKKAGYKKVWVNCCAEKHWKGGPAVGVFYAEPPIRDKTRVFRDIPLWRIMDELGINDSCGNGLKSADQHQTSCAYHYVAGVYDLTKPIRKP